MKLDCEGCAGCCIDWRPLADDVDLAETRGPRAPLDGAYNFVVLTRDEIAGFVDDGRGDALTPRLFEPTENDDVVTVDGRELAAVGDRPVFVVGLRKSAKPVAPFETAPHRLSTCVFLDPETLQCRVHGTDDYPETCSDYPASNLDLGHETECERVEAEFGGTRLLDGEPPADAPGPLFGPTAIGSSVFAHPEPAVLSGVVDRLTSGDLTDEDRARFVGPAVGSRPGSFDVNHDRAKEAAGAVRDADSWIGAVADAPPGRERELGDSVATDAPADAAEREERYGAPPTPGWE